MTIIELVKQSHKTAVEKGFWEGKIVGYTYIELKY